MNKSAIEYELSKMERISELGNVVRNLVAKQYLAGVQGESSVYTPLPENKLPKDDDIVLKCIFEVYRVFDLAYETGRKHEPFRLPFSDKYITSNGIATNGVTDKIENKGDSKMNTELQIFNYGEREIRTVQQDNETWWVLKDVCDVLELTTPARVAERLDEDEVSLAHITDSLGRMQQTSIINESGLYNVILRSDKPEAKQFKRWVTHEVLPTIRKTGGYIPVSETDTEMDIMAKAVLIGQKIMDEQKKKIGQLETINSELIIENEIMKPKSAYYDLVLHSKGALPITVIAKDYGKSAKWLNEKLHELGIQYKQGDVWVLYQKYADKGYTLSRTFPMPDTQSEIRNYTHTYWTQKGRLFIYETLKKEGIVPTSEKIKGA